LLSSSNVSVAADINEEIAQDEAEFSAELTTAAQAQRRLSALVQKSDAANPHHAWAHEHCIDTHAGCGCGPDDVVLVS
jgi:hypothetical protein